jgi:hypothetical protein
MPAQSSTIATRGGAVFVDVIRPRVPEGTRVPVILTFSPYSLTGASADDGHAGF